MLRAPNHLGDVILALPTLRAVGSDVMVIRGLAPVLEMAGLPGRVLPLARGPRGFARAVRELRRRNYERGVLLSAAFSAAWLFRCGAVRELRGTSTDGRAWLLRERISPDELSGMHRSRAFALLAGRDPEALVHPSRLEVPREAKSEWEARIRALTEASRGDAAGSGGEGRRARALVGIFPGSNAPARRWPAERFAVVAETMVERGHSVVILGGPAERRLTARVSASAPGCLDLGGRTDIRDLAAILSVCDLVVTNDTGPMHLAGAVGTPTVSLWGSSDPTEVRQRGSVDVRVAGAELPCSPCRRNRCRRRGRGTLLPEAHEECMRLIRVEDVLAAVEAAGYAGADDE